MTLDAPQDPGAQDLDLIAASLRADSTDADTFVQALAAKLEDALPGGARVVRGRERLMGPKRVRQITVDAGDRRLELKVAGAGVQTSASRVSGGVVIKTEELDIEAWLQALSAALAEQARRSQTTRQALERLLNG